MEHEPAYGETHASGRSARAGATGSRAGAAQVEAEAHDGGPVESPEVASAGEADAPVRRRGRRGGHRRRTELAEDMPAAAPEVPPVYIGPTPADPFGGGAFQLFDVVEQTEQQPLLPPPIFTPPLPLPEEPAAVAEPADSVERAETPSEPAIPQSPPEETTPEVPAEPAVKPFVIGADAPAAEKKRGWWRR